MGARDWRRYPEEGRRGEGGGTPSSASSSGRVVAEASGTRSGLRRGPVPSPPVPTGGVVVAVGPVLRGSVPRGPSRRAAEVPRRERAGGGHGRVSPTGSGATHLLGPRDRPPPRTELGTPKVGAPTRHASPQVGGPKAPPTTRLPPDPHGGVDGDTSGSGRPTGETPTDSLRPDPPVRTSTGHGVRGTDRSADEEDQVGRAGVSTEGILSNKRSRPHSPYPPEVLSPNPGRRLSARSRSTPTVPRVRQELFSRLGTSGPGPSRR